MSYVIDHADIVVTHQCNMHCPFCVDKYVRTDASVVSIESIKKFLTLLKNYGVKDNLEVLLLGGEPTTIDTDNLIEIADTIKSFGFSPIMSTNGVNKRKILDVLDHFDWIQVTVHSDKQIDYYRQNKDKMCIKLSGDQTMSYQKFMHFIEYTGAFPRRCISMFSTSDFKELCTDRRVWEILNSLDWYRNGSYMYTFYRGVRLKKFIPGETNIIDEPTVPKLYPNGNYNKTWCNENMDAYLGELK